MSVLALCARHGRLILVLGLLTGALLPGLAATMRPHLPWMVAVLLFLSAFRIGWPQTIGQLAQVWRPLTETLALQLALPLAAFALFATLGLTASLPALAVLLMLSAPSITGAPNFTILAGSDPAPAMQILILGTALFPLTALPMLQLLGPHLPGMESVTQSALRLIGVILIAVALGFLARATFLPRPSEAQIKALDGLGVVALAVIVVGLMTGLGPLLRGDYAGLALWLGVTFAANFGLQIVTYLLLPKSERSVAISIISGNRNIALFILALPAATIDPLLPFIGAYQLPMYLTPLLLARLHR